MTLELAPAAIIRAPAWPIETLEPFGDPDLANECCSAHPIDSAYETAVNRERMALWDRTVGDPSFMRALLLASPSLFERARAYKAPLGARSKSVRHLETSLYRYLARAAARPTPNHLWAGVTLAPFCDKERIVPAVPRADFSPDLAPFAFALNALGKRNVYRQSSIWRICLTLRRQQDGAWRFMVRLPGGATEIRQIETKHALDDYFDRLRNAGTGTLRDLSVRADVPLEFVERLADAGVLVGGLSFPVRFTSPWEALKLVEDALVGNDRDVWKQARTSLAEFSDRLAVGFDRMAANDMVEITGRARALIAQFLAAIDVKIDVPPMPFRCDFRLPFNVTLGRRTQRDLQNTLELYQSEWIDHVSPSSSARRERRRALAKTLADVPVRIGGELPHIDFDRDFQPQLWAETFRSPNEQFVLGSGTPHDEGCAAPWGSLIVQLGQSRIARVVGVDDSPVRLFGRHCNLFGLDNVAARWVQELFSRVEAECGVAVGDLAIPFENNPNVLARPSVAPLLIAPWNVEGIDLHKAEIRAEGGALLLNTPSHRRIAAVPCSPARVLDRDLLAASIAITGFDEPVDPSFRAASQIGPDEAEFPRYAPRVVLSSGATVRPRRTCLSGQFLAELTRLPRKARYRRWRELSGRLQWPEHITISADGEPPLLVPSSSPLAVEAALQAAWRARRIIIEEAETTGWLQGVSGSHVAEVIVPFSRTPNAFSPFSR